MMKRAGMRKAAMAWLLGAVLMIGGFSAAQEITVMGTVNSQYQILSDDDAVYTLGNGEQDEALAMAVGKRVVVIGTVLEHEGWMTISVISYQILE